ncbi:MAG TPA: hypothetical protein VMF66_07780 [Candidatus Acidoferrum sp.]|nr:hypothetical protein [Candidatus Acidoferrum sp.]
MYGTFPRTQVEVAKIKLPMGVWILACLILGVCAAAVILFA